MLHKCAVRIEAKNGEIAGTGFLIGKKEAVTCAHVVKKALQIIEDKVPQGELTVFSHGKRISAHVHADGWHPSDDIAVLSLTADLPDAAQVAILSKESFAELLNRSVSTLGFPEGHGSDGVCANDWKIKSKNMRHIQLEYDGKYGIPILPGFSGAPVLDMHFGRIVGMIVKTEKNVNSRISFAIPAEAIARVWPILLKKVDRKSSCPERESSRPEREICEEYLRESFYEDNKYELISICRNNFPGFGRTISDQHNIDKIIYMFLGYCERRTGFSAFWIAMKTVASSRYEKLYSEWEESYHKS